jgi:hypothetical protein
LTTAACGGLRPAPDCRPRRALLHLSYSSAPSYSDGAFVTHAPLRTWRGLGRRGHVDGIRRGYVQRAHDLFLFGQRSPAKGVGQQIGRLPGRLAVWLRWRREQSGDRSANAGDSPEPTTGNRGGSASRSRLARGGTAGRRANQIRPAGLITHQLGRTPPSERLGNQRVRLA